MAALLMEYTTVEDTKTVAEIQQYLASHGASSVQVEYEGGAVSSVAFRFKIGDQHIPFRLPCRWTAIEAILRKKGKRPTKRDSLQSMARRIAWRQILRWVEAQLAIIETGMVKKEEVFLPYAVVNADGHEQTMFNFIESRKFLALGGPAKPEPSE